MCGVACILGKYDDSAEKNILDLLRHRGPDDNGVYKDNEVTLLHTRLSILDVSDAGHQPMRSSCGNYVICYNGEIYNHLDLRKKYLANHVFKSGSDTETLIELFRLQKEQMLSELVGMWSMFIWDITQKKLFISRDRYGQKPLYYKKEGNNWSFASEIKPLQNDGYHPYDPTAIAEFLALGNYGHLGTSTFFKDVKQFPPGSYAWLIPYQATIQPLKYWELPFVSDKEKRPFDEKFKKELHDVVVEAVLSQTLSDVPVGITLSGGIDSSIITGILATHYNKNINVFTAQAVGSSHDESMYVDAMLSMYPEVTLHKKDLRNLSIKEDIYRYVSVQEEPFGDPSIIAHGSLMQMAAEDNIKVIIGGQGADELFFGYTNMVSAVMLQQVRKGMLSDFMSNMQKIKVGKGFIFRMLLLALSPGFERNLRIKSRYKRRSIIADNILKGVDDSLLSIPRYSNIYDVWKESMYGIHLPHLVHYDDRNSMSYSIEGRMPFLDHRIAELIATLRPEYLYKNGLRKYPLREACGMYIPDIIKNRTDKIGFFTPLINAIYKDSAWISNQLQNFTWICKDSKAELLKGLSAKEINIGEALLIWRFLVTKCWVDTFNIKI